MRYPIKENTWLGLFEFGIALKGLKGAGEIILGLAVLLVSKETIIKVFLKAVNSDFFQDLNIQGLQNLGGPALHFLGNLKTFAGGYIILHGALSVFIVVCLHLKKLWAYKVMLVFTGVFMAYQLYEIVFNRRYLLGVVTLYDIALVILTWHEYQYNKKLAI